MRLENYIMEQDINTSTVADIFAEQAQAELNVSLAIASSYAKEAMIMEYVMEGTTLDAAINKGVDESKLKKALLFIPRFFKAIFTRFIAMFKKKDVAAAKKMVDNIPDAVKSEVLVPMTEKELDMCMTAIDNVAGMITGKGSNNGIIGKLSAFCEKVYYGNYNNHKDLEFSADTIRSIEVIENFNLSKLIAKHRAKYNELARQMAGEQTGASFQVKGAEEAKSSKQRREEEYLAPEGSWLGKMPSKKINVDQATGGDNFADVAKFEKMIEKLDNLRGKLVQFKKDADETIKDLEAAVKKDSEAKAEKSNPELRAAISSAIELCNRVNKACAHFCDEIEKVIGIEMSIVNEVSHVSDFKFAKNQMKQSDKRKSKLGIGNYSGSQYIDSKTGTAKTVSRNNNLIDPTKEKGGSWGLNDALA
jgi:hypothetical protein